MRLTRRGLIAGFATLAPMTAAGHLWAAPATDARLLVVFLRGAYQMPPTSSSLSAAISIMRRDRLSRSPGRILW